MPWLAGARWSFICPSIETFLFALTAKNPKGWICVCMFGLSAFSPLVFLCWGQNSWRKNSCWWTWVVCVVSSHICAAHSPWEASTMHHRAWECQSLIGATSPCLIRWNFLAEWERLGKDGGIYYADPITLCSFFAPLKPLLSLQEISETSHSRGSRCKGANAHLSCCTQLYVEIDNKNNFSSCTQGH